MPWVRIDEKAMEHPKVVGLPDGAFRLWVQGLAHCQKYLTNGHIDQISMRALRAFSPKRTSELVGARLWLEVGDGIHVHDYLEWNDSREHVQKLRQQGRERIRRLRGKHSNTECNAVTASEQSANDLRSYSGDVLCLSSGSSVKEKGPGKTVEQRAGDFCQWYEDTHERLTGVGYIGTQNDYQAALKLCQKLADAEVRDAALVWFGMDDDFAKNGTRTIPKFASRASGCLQLAKQVGIA